MGIRAKIGILQKQKSLLSYDLQAFVGF